MPLSYATAGPLAFGLSWPLAWAAAAAGYVVGPLNLFTDNFAGSSLDPLKWRRMSGGSATVSLASPGVVTLNAHGFVANQQVNFPTAAPPAPLTQTTTYFVRNPTANTFELSATSGGASINTSASSAGILVCSIGYLGTGLKAFSVNNKLIETSDGSNNTNYGGIEAVNLYDLTANAIYAKVYNTTAVTAHQQIFSMVKDAQNRLDYYNDGTNGLRVVTTIGGSQVVQSGTLAWPGAPTWIRIRESGGNILWDTAPDSANSPGAFTNRKTLATPFAVTSMYPQIISGHFAGAVDADDIENFGGFNTTALS